MYRNCNIPLLAFMRNPPAVDAYVRRCCPIFRPVVAEAAADCGDYSKQYPFGHRDGGPRRFVSARAGARARCRDRQPDARVVARPLSAGTGRRARARGGAGGDAKARLPGISTITGDATELEAHLAERGIDRLCAVVSSLPIKWFPLSAQRDVLAPCLVRLGPGGTFLQLTNAFSSPIARQPLGLAGACVARVWRNLPPAQIWAYSAVGE
jgi:hypothetical protein